MKGTFKTAIFLSLVQGAYIACCLLAVAGVCSAQAGTAPSPTPSDAQTQLQGQPLTVGDYSIISSVEVGARGLSVDGNNDKYRADLNYRGGVRLFEASFLMRANEGKGRLLNVLVINSSGWGSDPHGYLRVNAEKGRWYRFDANFRRNAYDNVLRNLALGQHTSRYKHNFGDFDLRLLPTNRLINFSLGYSGDRSSGPGTTTYNFQRDEIQIGSHFRTRADEFRAGVEGRVGRLNLGFLQGFRWYGNDTTNSSGFNRGNNLTNQTVLTFLQRDQPMHGRAAFTRVSATTTVAQQMDITGRYTYTHARTKFLDSETSTGVNSTGNLFNPDVIDFTGTTERPAHLAELGITWRATRRLRVQEWFRYNRFRNEGAEVFSQMTFVRRPNGTPVTPFPATTSVPISRLLEYRRVANQLKIDYQFGPRLSAHVGYRITDRRIEISGLGRLLPTPVSATASFDEQIDTTNHGFFGGFRAKPTQNWTIYFDAEKGQADNTFTRLDNLDQVSFRGRARWTARRNLSVNLNFTTRDNNNPGVGVIDRTIFGNLDSTPFSVDLNSRIFGGSIDYSPLQRFSLSSGYTHMRLTTDAEILYFAGLPGSRFATGRSQYYLRDNFFFFNLSGELHRRISVYASYRVNDDDGQGNRVTNDPAGLFIRSLPFTFQSPEVKLMFRVNRRIDWNVGYQYYSYKEQPPFNTGQDYRAHLPFTSLRIYFGAER